jgi:type IV pilus assembly protein PilV
MLFGQRGSSLLEVLVSMVILAFGVLALGVMMVHAVQLPKFAGYRATAVNLAASHIEKIRANPSGFQSGEYSVPMSYDATFNEIQEWQCAYPNCGSTTLAQMDARATNRAVRLELPAGGTLTTCSSDPCDPESYGNVWIMWQEPASNANIGSSGSDSCPQEVIDRFNSALPRCLYVRFKP